MRYRRVGKVMGGLLMEKATCIRASTASPNLQIPHAIASPPILPHQIVLSFKDLASCLLSNLSVSLPAPGKSRGRAVWVHPARLLWFTEAACHFWSGRQPRWVSYKGFQAWRWKAFACQSGVLGQRTHIVSLLHCCKYFPPEDWNLLGAPIAREFRQPFSVKVDGCLKLGDTMAPEASSLHPVSAQQKVFECLCGAWKWIESLCFQVPHLHADEVSSLRQIFVPAKSVWA